MEIEFSAQQSTCTPYDEIHEANKTIVLEVKLSLLISLQIAEKQLVTTNFIQNK